MTPYKLDFNYKDLFLSPRIALSGKKIWIFLTANLFGFIVYWIFTYLSMLSSGGNLKTLISQQGLYPSMKIGQLTFLPSLLSYTGIAFWALSLFLASAAVNRVTLKQLKGNEFFSTQDAWLYVRKNWTSIIFPPFIILIILSLFIFFAFIFGLLGSIPFLGPFLVCLPYPIYFFGSIFTIYSIFVLSTSLNLSPSIASIYEEDAMGVVFQSYSVTWSQPLRIITYNCILFPILYLSGKIFSWFFLSGIGFIKYIFGNQFAMGDNFYQISDNAITLVYPTEFLKLLNNLDIYIENLLSFKFSLPLLFPLSDFSNNYLIDSSYSFAGIILSAFYFLIGLSIFSYVLSTFSVGQAMIFIIFKMKSDDDNILTRRDQDEIEEEEDDDKNLNIKDLIIEEKPENSDSFNEGVNKD